MNRWIKILLVICLCFICTKFESLASEEQNEDSKPLAQRRIPHAPGSAYPTYFPTTYGEEAKKHTDEYLIRTIHNHVESFNLYLNLGGPDRYLDERQALGLKLSVEGPILTHQNGKLCPPGQHTCGPDLRMSPHLMNVEWNDAKEYQKCSACLTAIRLLEVKEVYFHWGMKKKK